jgi:hypothetical protein
MLGRRWAAATPRVRLARRLRPRTGG